MNEREMALDLAKEPTIAPVLYLGQGDRNGTVLKVSLYDNGNVLDLDGCGVSFCMRTPDGLDYYEVVGTADGNVAEFLIDETYAAGHVGKTDEAYVSVTDPNDAISSTSRFSVVVLRNAKDGVEPAPAYVTLIEQFLERSQEAVDEIIETAQEVLDDGIPLMAPTRRGGAKLGSSLAVGNDELLDVVPATASQIGGVRVGAGLSMAGDVMSVDISAAGGIPATQKGAANGVATLDSSGLVPSGQLPSYVDDVIEGYYYQGAFYEESTHETPIVGETGKIYVDLSTDTSYRWSGSAYISISNPIDIATEAEALAGNDNTKMMTPLRVKQVVTGDIAPNSVTTGDVTAEDVTADSVTSSGEVTATETLGGGTRTHELTEKLDEDDYLSGLTWDMLAARFTWDDLAGTMGQDETTTNLDLAKPAHVSAAAMNANMDKIDAAVGAVGDTSLQEQVNRRVYYGIGVSNARIYSIPSDENRLSIRVEDMNGGAYTFVVTDTLYGLLNASTGNWVWVKNVS